MDLFAEEQAEYRYQNGVNGRGLRPFRRLQYVVRLVLSFWVPLLEWKAVLGRRGIRTVRSVQFMNDLCNATNGRGLDAGGKIVASLRRRDTRAFDRDELPRLTARCNLPANELDRVVTALRTDGFAVIRQFTTSEIAETIRAGVEGATSTDWQGSRYSNYEEWSRLGATSRIDVDPEVVASVVDGSGIDLSAMDLIARKYLEVAPIRIPPQCWITHHRPSLSTADLEETAMSYHCDSDFLSFFKTFLLLTPVSDENGPFAFVGGSHQGRRQVQGRVSDANLGIVDSERRLGTGQPGDLVLAATMGWHKGTPVRAGHRSMIQWLYTTSLFGRATK